MSLKELGLGTQVGPRLRVTCWKVSLNKLLVYPAALALLQLG